MRYFDVVFDGPPGAVAGRFVEVNDDTGSSIKVGEWIERDDGYWVLRIWRWDAEMIERVAEVEHAHWAHWTTYMLDHMTDVNIARWRQQAVMPYLALTPDEKESDREWARKALAAAHG